MFDPLTATIGSGAISSILGFVGAGQQASASQKAADLQSQAARDASSTLQNYYQQAAAGMQPYTNIGGQAVGRLGELAGAFSSQAPVKPQAPDESKYIIKDSWGNEHFSQGLYDARQKDYASAMEKYNQDFAQYQLSGGATAGQMQTPTVGGLSPSGAYSQYTQPTTIGGLSPSDAYSQYTGEMNVDVTQDPGYQFRMQQGLDALQKSAAAKGGFFSGQTGKDITDYAQGMASQEYQNAYNREMANRQMGLGAYGTAYGQEMAQKQFGLGAYGSALDQERAAQTDQYNRLASLAGMGQTAASQTGQWGLGAAQQLGQYGLGSAQAQGQGLMNQAGAWQGGLQNFGNQLTSGIGNVLNYSLAKNYLNQNNRNSNALGPGY